MELEALKQRLLSRMSDLKQQEQALELFLSSTEKEQSEAIELFKTEINSAFSSLSNVPENFAIASKKMDSIFTLANNLSSRIQEVDTAISRCTDASNYVNHLADLHECLGSIDKDLEEKNIHKICDSIHRLIQIPEGLLNQEESNKINEARKKTIRILQDHFSTSEDLNQMFDYFIQIDAKKEGIEIFVQAQRQKIIDEIHDDRITLIQLPPAPVTDDSRAPHVDVYVKLLNLISSRILSSLVALPDPGHFSVFIRLLLERMDTNIEEIIKQYSEYRKLDDLEQNSETRLTSLDLVNEEISIFAHQFALFEKFIAQKLSKGILTPFFTECQYHYQTDFKTGLPRNTAASRSREELLIHYSVLTQNYLAIVTDKLLKTIRLMEKTVDVTYAIDDLFFVFKRTLNRSITTLWASTTCTTFNVITSIIRDQLMVAIKPKTWFITKEIGITEKYGVQINACQVVNVYLNKLTELIETTITKQFVSDDLMAIQLGVNDLKICGAQLQEELDKQFLEMKTKLDKTLKILCRPFNETKWDGQISIEHKTELEHAFNVHFLQYTESYKQNLNMVNYQTLMRNFALDFCQELLSLLLTKRFNLSGAKLFQVMVKLLSPYFDKSPHLNKLSDMALILVSNTQDDARKLVNDTENSIDFTPNEVEKIIKLRIDWN